MSELMDIQNRSALNITPNSSRPATPNIWAQLKDGAIFLSHSGTKKSIGFFFSVPSPKGTETWSFNKKLVFYKKIIELGYKTLVWGLNRSSSISIKHYDAQNESSILLTKENGHVFGRQSSLIRAIFIFSLKCLSEGLKPLKVFFLSNISDSLISRLSRFPQPHTLLSG